MHCYRDAEAESRRHGALCGCWCLLVTTSLLFSFACGLAATFLFKNPHVPRSTNYTYAVGIDAGSSHTQLFLYQWPTSKLNGTGVVQELLCCPSHNEPKMVAVGGFINNPSDAGFSLKPCLDKVIEHLKVIEAEEETSLHLDGSTPVFLGATAGMRLVQQRNASIAEMILKSVHMMIRSYPLDSSESKLRQRVIEGMEEGVFAWIATNYLLGSFGFKPIRSKHSRGKRAILAKPTVGALDLGGASTQITFVPAYGSDTDSANVKRLELYGSTYSVYSHSHLCFGINEAFKKYLASLVRNQNYSEFIEDPCAPAGNKTMFAGDEIFQTPCTTPSSSEMKMLGQRKMFVFHGTSSSKLCRVYTGALFRPNASCTLPPCSLNGTHMPPIHGTFQAFSSFYLAMKFLNLTDDLQRPSLEKFLETKDSYCNKTWSQVSSIPLEAGDKPSTLVQACFRSNYILSLLLDVYRFNSTTWRNINFQNQASGAELGWILGMIINVTNQMPAVTSSSLVTSARLMSRGVVFYILVVFELLFIGLAFALAVQTIRTKRVTLNQEYVVVRSASLRVNYGSVLDETSPLVRKYYL